MCLRAYLYMTRVGSVFVEFNSVATAERVSKLEVLVPGSETDKMALEMRALYVTPMSTPIPSDGIFTARDFYVYSHFF